MRRPLPFVLATSALAPWFDGLLWKAGDAGTLGWLLEVAVPQLFLLLVLPGVIYALRKRAWGAIGTAVAGAQIFGPMGMCLGRASDEPADLRVASYNVEKFGASYEAVARTIRGLGADVVCLQEAGHDRHGFPMPERFRALLPEYRYYAAHGMAILSKRPFRETRTHRFETPMGHAGWNLQEIALDVGGRTVRVFNVHMMPRSYQPDPPVGPYGFSERVEVARRFREAEADEVLARAGAGEGPTVLCGDFNQPPFGPRYRRLARVFQDSFRATSVGFGSTTPAEVPLKRIDYVWTHGLRPLRTQVVDRRTSDHLPVIADLAWRGGISYDPVAVGCPRADARAFRRRRDSR